MNQTTVVRMQNVPIHLEAFLANVVKDFLGTVEVVKVNIVLNT